MYPRKLFCNWLTSISAPLSFFSFFFFLLCFITCSLGWQSPTHQYWKVVGGRERDRSWEINAERRGFGEMNEETEREREERSKNVFPGFRVLGFVGQYKFTQWKLILFFFIDSVLSGFVLRPFKNWSPYHFPHLLYLFISFFHFLNPHSTTPCPPHFTYHTWWVTGGWNIILVGVTKWWNMIIVF